jgi:PIN like domain
VATQQPVIYVENNVGQGFVRAFNEFSKDHGYGALFQNHVHPVMQRPQYGDAWWIEQIANLGYALLTCDTAIVENDAEREAVIKSCLRYVGFASAEYDGWTQMRAVTTHWIRLAAELDQPGPVIVKLYVGQAPEVERP